MKHLSLFSGIGGLDLAAEMAGFRTIGQVEIDDYCNRVLEYHWPNVPRWRDVKDVTAESFERRTGIKPGTLAVLSGGFPCQPFSFAGKRKGEADNRFLWPEMLRVICEVRPRWIVAENVRGILSIDTGRTFGRILSDLAENGYRVGWLCYGAGDVGAPHKRERVFIVAYSQSRQSWQQETRNGQGGTCGRSKEMGHATEQGLQSREDVADTEKPKGAMDRPIASEQEQGQFGGRGGEGVLADTKKSGLSQSQGRGRGTEKQPRSECYCIYAREQATERPTQPRLGNSPDGFPAGLAGHRWPAGPGPQYPWEPPRIATGVKDRVAKLKALGNAVVPAQAYPIFKAIMEIEVAGCMKIIAEVGE